MVKIYYCQIYSESNYWVFIFLLECLWKFSIWKKQYFWRFFDLSKKLSQNLLLQLNEIEIKKKQRVKSCTVIRGTKWHKFVFLAQKLQEEMHFEIWVKIRKKSFFAHKNENISKSCGPILKNSTPIVFFLNSAYHNQFLKKSVQNWKKNIFH